MVADLACGARLDTIHGGVSHLIAARQADIPGFDPLEIVSQIYSASTGKPSPDWEAWECPECGTAHLGQERALECCQPIDE